MLKEQKQVYLYNRQCVFPLVMEKTKNTSAIISLNNQVKPTKKILLMKNICTSFCRIDLTLELKQ